MKNQMQYKGYVGAVEYDGEEKLFFGKVMGINDLVTFEGASVKALEKAFKDSVDDYLKTCLQAGKDPDRTFRGSFNVRVNPEVHRLAAFKAEEFRISLNEFVEQAISKAVGFGFPEAGLVSEKAAKYSKGTKRKKP